MKKAIYLLVGIVTVLLTSCSESGDEANEFENWQNRNDVYFSSIYNEAKQASASGDASWKVIRSFSKDASTTNIADYIVVKVLNEGGGTESPLFTDSVSIHYRGYLMPSASYDTKVAEYPHNVGYSFDGTWTGDYRLPLMMPISTVYTNFVNGFATALQNMHAGDRWLVYMPYQLSYGETEKTSIPAYSTLVFDITLSRFWKKRVW